MQRKKLRATENNTRNLSKLLETESTQRAVYFQLRVIFYKRRVMYKVALKECDETKIAGRFFSYTQFIIFYKLKLYDMQGNKKLVKYQGMNGKAILRQIQSKMLIILTCSCTENKRSSIWQLCRH